MSKVIVKKVPGFSDYSVSSNGDVISHKFGKEKVLAPSTSTGYKKVSLVNPDGESVNFQVHRLVALTFLKNPKDYYIVNHIDGDKMNNKLSNLEWTDRKSNAQHYEKVIKPKNVKARTERAQNDIMSRLKIISHAHSACAGNFELFQTIVDAALKGCKGI